MSAAVYEIQPRLPWDVTPEERRRLAVLYAIAGLLVLIFGTMIWLTPIKQLDRSVAEAVPPRVAKMLLQQEPVKPIPPPPPPEVKKEEEKPEVKPEEKKPEPPKQEVKKEEPKKEPVKKEAPKKVDPVTAAQQRQQAAKKQAAAAVAVFDDLGDIRDTTDLSGLKTEQSKLSTNATAGPGTTANGVGVATERSLLSKAAVGGSGGVAIAKASSGGGGTGRLGGGGAGGAGAMPTTQMKSAIADPAAQQAEKRGKGGKARRTTEDVQLVFDRNKGAIYSLYRRALRENPALEGTLVLRLEIQPNGAVSRCEVVSSELKDPDLERKIVTKVKSINFGKLDVDVWNDSYPISFIPS